MALSQWEERLMSNLHVSLDHTWKRRISEFPLGGSIQQLLILNSEMHSKNFPNLGVHSTTFHLELRNERFILISFMGFPTILSTLQPFQICIFNRKQSKLTSSNGPQPMGRKVDGKFACIIVLYMEKQNFHQMSDLGVHSTTLDPELRNAFQNFHPDVRSGGSIPQLFILNSEMKDLY